MVAQTVAQPDEAYGPRRVQLVAGLICMVMIANLQYGWTLFVHPLSVAHGWSIAGDASRVQRLCRA